MSYLIFLKFSSESESIISGDTYPNEGLFLGSCCPNSPLMDFRIDDFRYWSKALSEDEITNNMNCSPETETDLILYWNFETGEGNIVYDQTGNQNHGAVNGATWVALESSEEDSFNTNYAIHFDYQNV